MDWLKMLAIAGMNGGGSGGSGGVSPEEVTTIVKEQFPGGVGYEEVQTVNEPLNITWDGNTDGLVRAEGEMPLFKLADVVLTDEQLKFTSVTLSAGFTYSIADEWDTWVNYGFVTEDVVMPEGVAFVRKDGAECMGMMFPNAGIYAFSGEAYVSAITTTEPIEQTKVVTKKLDAKYLPDKFLVTFSTADMQNWTCDKTLAEITEAINSGKEVVGSLMGQVKLDFTTTHPNGSVSFGAVVPDNLELLVYTAGVFEDEVTVTMAYVQMTAMGG